MATRIDDEQIRLQSMIKHLETLDSVYAGPLEELKKAVQLYLEVEGNG